MLKLNPENPNYERLAALQDHLMAERKEQEERLEAAENAWHAELEVAEELIEQAHNMPNDYLWEQRLLINKAWAIQNRAHEAYQTVIREEMERGLHHE